MSKKFIDTLIKEMREASELEPVNTFEDTKQNIAEVASKQVLRKMRVEGYASPYTSKRLARQTANRVLPEEKDKKCPPGYVFDKKQLMCVPIRPKDSVSGPNSGGKNLAPGNGAGYNTWGASGYNGDGYAWEEPPTSNDLADGGGGMSESGPAYPYESEAQAKAQRNRRFGRRNVQGDKTRQEPGNKPVAHTQGYNRPVKPVHAMTKEEHQAQEMVTLIDQLAYEVTTEDPWAMRARANGYDRKTLEETRDEAPDYEALQLKCETGLEMLSRKLIETRTQPFLKEEYEKMLEVKRQGEALLKQVRKARAKADPATKERQLKIARKGIK